MANIIGNNEEFNPSVMDFEDEVDCACLSDEDFQKALIDMNNAEVVNEEDDIIDDVEIVDTNIDYDGSIPSADIVDMDADDLIAAERDIAHDPFEDDEIIDAAIGDDEPDFEDDNDDDEI